MAYSLVTLFIAYVVSFVPFSNPNLEDAEGGWKCPIWPFDTSFDLHRQPEYHVNYTYMLLLYLGMCFVHHIETFVFAGLLAAPGLKACLRVSIIFFIIIVLIQNLFPIVYTNWWKLDYMSYRYAIFHVLFAELTLVTVAGFLYSRRLPIYVGLCFIIPRCILSAAVVIFVVNSRKKFKNLVRR